MAILQNLLAARKLTPIIDSNYPLREVRAAFRHMIEKEQTMVLGAFSISLAVKDIKASKAFYEKLGFKELVQTEKLKPAPIAEKLPSKNAG